MKKIVIINIPDESYEHDKDLEDFINERIKEWYNFNANAEIFIPPTEEEMIKQFRVISLAGQSTVNTKALSGAKWFKSLLK